MTEQHSEGPWTFDPNQDGQPILGVHGQRICDMDCVDLWEEAEASAEGSTLMSTADENWEILNAERDADARLIAAAPELLGALEKLLLHAEAAAYAKQPDGIKGASGELVWALSDARAAIKKAKGE